MKICRVSVEGSVSYGLVEGDSVYLIDGNVYGDYVVTNTSYDLGEVKLLVPCEPRSFWAVGLNYAAHIAHQEQALDADRIQRDAQEFRPWQKGTSCIISTGSKIELPSDADYVHYEGELAVVIGKRAKHVDALNAPDYIFGYTCANDVSGEGEWSKDLSNWRRKCPDTFGPVGPWSETELDPHKTQITTILNESVHDTGETSGMIYNCYETVSRISEFVTLYPGDLILTGAPGAVEQLNPGDTVEVEIAGIGRLSNPVV